MTSAYSTTTQKLASSAPSVLTTACSSLTPPTYYNIYLSHQRLKNWEDYEFSDMLLIYFLPFYTFLIIEILEVFYAYIQVKI